MVSRRRYSSATRKQNSEARRGRIIAATLELLGEGVSPALERVARRAGVTRLTIYNLFGSRRVLLEAAFDDRAAQTGVFDLRSVMADARPTTLDVVIARIVGTFSRMWSEGSMDSLMAACATDSELAAMVAERNERRRMLWATVLKKSGAHVSTSLVDTLFALTSQGFYASLTSGGVEPKAAEAIIVRLVTDAIANRAGRPI